MPIMFESHEWKSHFEQEINRATQARMNGNEGMARVCARRAVGVAIGEYLAREGYQLKSASAINHLRFLVSLPGIPHHIRTVAGHFLLHTDKDHRFPEDIDLISEAHLLVESLEIT